MDTYADAYARRHRLLPCGGREAKAALRSAEQRRRRGVPRAEGHVPSSWHPDSGRSTVSEQWSKAFELCRKPHRVEAPEDASLQAPLKCVRICTVVASWHQPADGISGQATCKDVRLVLLKFYSHKLSVLLAGRMCDCVGCRTCRTCRNCKTADRFASPFLALKPIAAHLLHPSAPNGGGRRGASHAPRIAHLAFRLRKTLAFDAFLAAIKPA